MCCLEKYLIEHCAPTLASLKAASLFRISIFSKEELEEQLLSWNRILGQKGISICLLRQHQRTALIYVYRRSQLQASLQRPEAECFLACYGYRQLDVENALFRLQTRLAADGSFPHEIGVFLGYPLEDVVGFIQNCGRNCKCSGCWKVYCNESEAKKQFERFRKCREVYSRLWEQGRSVWQLTVAA